MRFVVTGGAGFIGSAVVRQLIDTTQNSVLVVDKLTYAGNLENIGLVLRNPRCRFVQADICDLKAMRDAVADFRPQVILHLAAESHVDRSIDSPAEFIKTNIIGTFTLLQVALDHYRSLPLDRRAEFRFHHVSTDEVFGSLGPTGRFTEHSPYRPNSPYSASKASSDHLVRAWHHTYDLPVIVSNCSNNYGPFHFPDKLIPLTVAKLLARSAVTVYGNGLNVRDWLYVDDHARALTLIAEKGVVGDSYNIGGNCERTNIEVVRAVCRLMNELAPMASGDYEDFITFVPDRPGHDLRYAIDATNVYELGWRPQETFETGLRKTVRWFLDNLEWCEAIAANGYSGERLGLVT